MQLRAAPPFHRLALPLAALMCGLAVSAAAADTPPPVMSPAGIPAFNEAMLAADFWIRRAPAPDNVLLDARATAAQRAAAYAPGGGFLDIRRLPAMLTRDQVADWIRAAEQSPVTLAVDDAGRPVGPDTLQSLRTATAADRIANSSPARYGLAVRRAAMRTLPSDRAFYAAPDQKDYESLTAGTLFPGEPVLIAHASADGRWLLAVTTQGPAWLHADDIAEGQAATVFGYAAQPPGRVITGDHVRTVFTPELPAVSALDLDMGVALPHADVRPDAPVNGASPYASCKDTAGGALRKTKLNQVAVTPLLPLYADDTTLYVDAMTSLVQPTRR